MPSAHTRLAGIVLAIAAMSGLGAISAQAHSQLVSSTPANGATLASAPAAVIFEFDEPLLPDLDTVSINDEQGANVYSQKVAPVDNSLTIEWPATLPDGTYQVAYRVVSGDGHPVTGAISFTIGNAAPSSSPVASASTENSQAQAAMSPWALIAAVVLLAASIAVIYLLVKRRR